MSALRRSSRNTTAATNHVADVPVTVVKKEAKRALITKTTSVKRVKKQDPDEQDEQQQLLNNIKTPKNWVIVHDKLQAYREVNKAAVDTMGCERLADRNATPKIQRFQTLVSLMLSAQTKDTVTSAAVIKLQAELNGGLCLDSILALDQDVLDNMIKSVGFHTKKAAYIKRTAEILRDKYDGEIPDTIDGLTSLPGVGPKMGYLTLQVAWDKNLGIGVDVHVHRISNRLGWVKTKNPEETRLSLQSWLPQDKWKKINPIMVGYGQIVCLPRGPRCDVCPVSQYCPSSEIKKTTKIKKSNTTTKSESIYFVKKEEEDPTMTTAALDW